MLLDGMGLGGRRWFGQSVTAGCAVMLMEPDSLWVKLGLATTDAEVHPLHLGMAQLGFLGSSFALDVVLAVLPWCSLSSCPIHSTSAKLLVTVSATEVRERNGRWASSCSNSEVIADRCWWLLPFTWSEWRALGFFLTATCDAGSSCRSIFSAIAVWVRGCWRCR
jgi:hypothetical protein